MSDDIKKLAEQVLEADRRAVATDFSLDEVDARAICRTAAPKLAREVLRLREALQDIVLLDVVPDGPVVAGDSYERAVMDTHEKVADMARTALEKK